MMIDLRNNPVKEIDGSKVEYLIRLSNILYTTTPLTDWKNILLIDLPKSNVLIYQTEDGTRVAV